MFTIESTYILEDWQHMTYELLQLLIFTKHCSRRYSGPRCWFCAWLKLWFLLLTSFNIMLARLLMHHGLSNWNFWWHFRLILGGMITTAKAGRSIDSCLWTEESLLCHAAGCAISLWTEFDIYYWAECNPRLSAFWGTINGIRTEITVLQQLWLLLQDVLSYSTMYTLYVIYRNVDLLLRQLYDHQISSSGRWNLNTSR